MIEPQLNLQFISSDIPIYKCKNTLQTFNMVNEVCA